MLLASTAHCTKGERWSRWHCYNQRPGEHMADPASDGWPAGKVFEAAPQGFTYDDLVFMPQPSSFDASDVDLSSYITKNIRLKSPIIGSPSDTVTDSNMAIALALSGAMGIIHANQDIQRQVSMVQAVKRFVSGFVLEPVVMRPTHTLADLDKLRAATGITTVPITDTGGLGGELLGIVTARDADLCTDRREYLSRVMTERVVTAREPLSFEEALDTLKRAKVGKLLILNSDDQLVSMVTRSDLKKVRDFPDMSRDLSGKLLVGAAVPALPDGSQDWPRASALAEAGANVLYLFGDGVDEQLALIRRLKIDYPSVDVLAGPATSVREARRLVEAGADGIIAGSGNDAGADPMAAPLAVAVGRGEATMVYEVAYYVTRNYKLPVAAAGVRSTSQALVAMGLGASAVVLREPLAGTDEAPGGKQASMPLHHANSLVQSCASKYASSRAWERQELVQCTIATPVCHKGSVRAFLLYFLSGLRNGFTEIGFRNLEELHDGLEKEILRMECRLPFSLQLQEACGRAVKQSQHPEVLPISVLTSWG
eukprot:s2119_g2.t1